MLAQLLALEQQWSTLILQSRSKLQPKHVIKLMLCSLALILYCSPLQQRLYLHNITYQHLLTGIKKKLAHVEKTKECELIGEWIKNITNHLYWCAANAPDGDDIVKGWKSLMNHLCNIHEDYYHDPLHSLEERQKK